MSQEGSRTRRDGEGGKGWWIRPCWLHKHMSRCEGAAALTVGREKKIHEGWAWPSEESHLVEFV